MILFIFILNYISYLLINDYIIYLRNYNNNIFAYNRQKLFKIDELKLIILYISFYKR